MAPSSGPGCVQKEPSCAQRLAFSSIGPGAKSQNFQRSALVCWLCAKFCHQTSLQCTPQKPDLSSKRWSKRNSPDGAISSPQANVPCRGVLFPRKIVSAVSGMTSAHRSRGCSFSFLPRATNLRFSSRGSIPLCPLSAGVQDKWLQTKLCALALQEAFFFKFISSHLSLVDRNPLLFTGGCYLDYFPSSGAINWGAQLRI